MCATARVKKNLSVVVEQKGLGNRLSCSFKNKSGY